MERELLLLPAVRGGWFGAVAVAVVVAVVMPDGALALHRKRPHRERRPPAESGVLPVGPANVHMAPAGTIALPGRGLALSWAPDGHALAVGGRFRDRTTRLRYDTRIADVASLRLSKSFACHLFWVVATAWTQNPFVGEVIADGGADHMVKIWRAAGPGSVTCRPGQFRPEDGGLAKLPEIGGWTMALAFSPDGRYLAGASRDRAIRIWQVEPGAHQWKVVRLWYDVTAGNFLSVVWAPDGRALLTGDRKGRVAVWGFDPAADRWDDATIAAFARVGYEGQPTWFKQNASLVTRRPRWSEGGHGQVWAARWAPDGARVAAVGTDARLSAYDAVTGRVVYRTGAPRATALYALDWSPDGRFLAAGGADHQVYLFDAATGALHDRLEGHADLVPAVAWSPDGRLLASTAGGIKLSLGLLEAVAGPDQTVRLWAWR